MSTRTGEGSVSVPVRRFRHEGEEADSVAVEEPLLIELAWPGGSKPISVTMCTPGADENLAVGFLYGEGIIRDGAHIAAVVGHSDDDGARVRVELLTEPDADVLSQERNFFMTSSCGICGKAALDAVRQRVTYAIDPAEFRIAAGVISELPARLLDAQTLFAGTGSIHAAGFFAPSGQFVEVYEDVGRHNAVDKLVGSALRRGRLPATSLGLAVSGRASFELVQKAVMAGSPLLISVGAPSSLAIELAWESGMTLAGFVRDGRFNVYANPSRIADLS